MRYEIVIDNIILTCDVHSFTRSVPDFNTDSSDWDSYGLGEFEFTVESVIELDEDDLPYDLSKKEIDKLMADEGFVNMVEARLVKLLNEKEID